MEVLKLKPRVLLQPNWGLRRVAQRAVQKVEAEEEREAVENTDGQEGEGEFGHGVGHLG
jgi:hypothetical protein